jgi:hypothetical protein
VTMFSVLWFCELGIQHTDRLTVVPVASEKYRVVFVLLTRGRPSEVGLARNIDFHSLLLENSLRTRVFSSPAWPAPLTRARADAHLPEMHHRPLGVRL